MGLFRWHILFKHGKHFYYCDRCSCLLYIFSTLMERKVMWSSLLPPLVTHLCYRWFSTHQTALACTWCFSGMLYVVYSPWAPSWVNSWSASELVPIINLAGFSHSAPTPGFPSGQCGNGSPWAWLLSLGHRRFPRHPCFWSVCFQ